MNKRIKMLSNLMFILRVASIYFRVSEISMFSQGLLVDGDEENRSNSQIFNSHFE